MPAARMRPRRRSTRAGVDPDDRIEDVERDIVDGPNLPRSRWLAIAVILDTGSKIRSGSTARLREALVSTGAAQVDVYLGVFLTDAERTPRKSVVTKNFCDTIPRSAACSSPRRPPYAPDRAPPRGHDPRPHRSAAAYRDRGRGELPAREAGRGLLDYDDLIDKTLSMLDRVSSGWVHYKLDRGVDHVLIDEAQDTSPRQWDIVAHIISEFTSGAGARDGVMRTVFAVGDEKQSIFSFQGAAPREFDLRRRALKKKFEDAGLKFDPVSFTYSFRSGPAILQSVDHVFREQDIYRSIHAVEPISDPSCARGRRSRPDRSLGIGRSRRQAGDRRLARAVRRRFRDQPGSEACPAHPGRDQDAGRKRHHDRQPGSRRPLRYGDMLVLVRRRGNAFDAVIQALKHAGIPVAGADRLKLTEHIAIIDLMNLADALLLPQDDLALAVALKSPLFGLDRRRSVQAGLAAQGIVARALSAQAAADDRLSGCAGAARTMRAPLRHETPFAFYAWLLGGDGGRARILRRLGMRPMTRSTNFWNWR